MRASHHVEEPERLVRQAVQHVVESVRDLQQLRVNYFERSVPAVPGQPSAVLVDPLQPLHVAIDV